MTLGQPLQLLIMEGFFIVFGQKSLPQGMEGVGRMVMNSFTTYINVVQS